MNLKTLLMVIATCVQAQTAVSQHRRITDLRPHYQYATATAPLQVASQGETSSQSGGATSVELLLKGRLAFEGSCTKCHEAARALDESKDYAEWLETIADMATKEDAEVLQQDFHPIAVYLAARSTAPSRSGAAAGNDVRAGKTGRQGDAIAESGSAKMNDPVGRAAFEKSCLKCHDAERSLSKSKSFDEWMVTIRQMASKEDAEIKTSDFSVIARYLTDNASESGDSDSSSDENKDGEDKSKDFDPALIEAGKSAFNRSCLKCHDAGRSLSKSKSYSGWLSTVRRMATKDGAEIRTSDFSAIATYLASLSGTSGMSEDDVAAEGAGGWSFGTTISTIHRSASDESPVENPGFFADVWVTASYQSSGSWGATVTACTSCHSTNSSINFYSLEILEGSATVDVRKLFSQCKDDSGVQVLLKSGRFPVPFGAFSAMSHPGVYRTVTAPLMFNMGRRVFASGAAPPRQPVLPLPFADEGIDLMLSAPLANDVNLGVDLFAVNGLQGSEGNLFRNSRAYSDNNEEPTFGLRTTLGGDFLKLGASLLHGGLQDQGQPLVDYTIWGADGTAQLTDRLRLYGEFARRRQDSSVLPGTSEKVFGVIGEAEYKLLKKRNVSMIVRYDTLEHRSLGFGDDAIERLTSGFNIGLPGGSLLMINHEHWQPEIGNDVDLVGVRWSVSL